MGKQWYDRAEANVSRVSVVELLPNVRSHHHSSSGTKRTTNNDKLQFFQVGLNWLIGNLSGKKVVHAFDILRFVTSCGLGVNNGMKSSFRMRSSSMIRQKYIVMVAEIKA